MKNLRVNFSASKNNLKPHEHIHNGEKSYSCKCCDKKFRQSDLLKNHKITHMGEKTFSFKFCQKSCNRANLKQHENTHRKKIIVIFNPTN